eukprot:SAG11_NODE_63_length_18904_cov_11.842914_2_plen_103_part_00
MRYRYWIHDLLIIEIYSRTVPRLGTRVQLVDLRKQRVSWIRRPSDLVFMMALVTALVTIDDGNVSCDLTRPSRSSSPQIPQRLWGTRMAFGGHIFVDRCAFS